MVGLAVAGALPLSGRPAAGEANDMLIDDFNDPALVSKLGTPWRGVSDRVMGGVSKVDVTQTRIDGRSCLHLRGDVRLENNGGFIQAALDLTTSDTPLDASRFTGVRLLVRGNGEVYGVHLRTPNTYLPWQSYRATFVAPPTWTSVALPFDSFEPYRLNRPLDRARLRRIGLVAIGRAFRADLAVAELALYR